MLLDRGLQLSILTQLSKVYPTPEYLGNKYDVETERKTEEYCKYVANLAYLRDHNLISEDSLRKSQKRGSYESEPNLAAITHKGMDFLADDGGLAAILGVVTIKFETEQLKLLLEAKIRSSDLPIANKDVLIKALWEMPAEGVKHLTTKIVDTGWGSLGSLMTLLETNIF